MKIILVRHGESEANVAGVLSSSPDDMFGLTERGRVQVKSIAKHIPGRVDGAYVSPLLRTRQTADILFGGKPDPDLYLKIDDRIAEIDYGKYSGKPNNAELDAVREAQASGDYFIKFGDFGENKREILRRLYDFLIDIIKTNSSAARVVVISHGSIISWLERIIVSLDEQKKKHKSIANAEVREYTLRQRNIDALAHYRSRTK